MELETKRLIIRIPKMNDAKNLSSRLNNKNISKNMMNIPFPYNIQMARKFIKKSINSIKETPIKKYDFVIELKSTKQVIGGICIADIDYFRGIAGISYWLDENYWKQGIMSEAVFAILNFAFKKLKMQRINLTCNENNEGSKAIAKKFGFKLEGVIRKAHKPISTGKVADKYYYGLLKEEWKKSKKRLKMHSPRNLFQKKKQKAFSVPAL